MYTSNEYFIPDSTRVITMSTFESTQAQAFNVICTAQAQSENYPVSTDLLVLI